MIKYKPLTNMRASSREYRSYYIPSSTDLTHIYRILGEGLLISSLPGKALRTLVDIVRLAERFNMRKLDIKRREPGIVFYISVYPCFTLQTSDFDKIIGECVDSAPLATSLKICNVIMT